jgi:transglutaminase-like putative cysteine protease
MSASTSATGSHADRQGDRAPQPAPSPGSWLSLTPDDGWLTLVLLAAVVFITVSSIQSVTPPWAPGLQILTATTAIGLLLGYLVVQQGRIPPSIVHSLAILLGVVFAVNQTAGAVLGGDWKLLLSRMASWFRLAFLGGRGSTDNAVFLLFLGILTFLLAYISYWLVVQTRRPWLAVLANGTVLLINLNWGTDNLVIFLVLFLLAAMLLLVRFTLAENMRHWRARGLRFSPDLGWDFMQAGAILAVVVLLLAYILPVGAANAEVLRALNDPQGAWQKAQGRFELLFGGLVGPKGTGGGGGGLFGPSIHLVGKVDLPDIPILHYTVEGTGDASQYLLAQTLDSYDGVNAWTQSQSQQHSYAPGVAQPASGTANTTDSYTVTFDLTDGDGQHALVVPGSEAESFSVPTFSYFSLASNMPTSWEAQRPLQRGESFVATGYASHASEPQLRAVLSPAQAAKRGPNDANTYDPELLAEYVGNEGSISPEIRQTAQVATKGTTNMYDAAVALEDYLRSGFTYSTNNPEPPPDQDATVWFLNQKKGYCTFFASAMALMGRSLGMPTRVASGFISGAYDQKSNTYVVKGTASHAWTQVYFAGYGWVNFEPTASFDRFIRPISTTTQTPTPTGSTTPGANGTPHGTATPRDLQDPNFGSGGGGGDTGALRATLGGSALLLLLLLGAAFALIWWRLLFRGMSPAAAAFGRITRLGTWAGAPPSRAQTPMEYAEHLSEVTPGQRGAIRQLGTAYSRERYGGGVPPDLARQLPSLYDQVRGALAQVITRRAYRVPLALLRRVGLGRRGGSGDAR